MAINQMKNDSGYETHTVWDTILIRDLQYL